MLERLRIENFKAWRDTGDIQFAPLTIFFGPNSSGKTSLIQLLLLLQQSAQSSDLAQVLDFGDEHTAVDLGSFADVIHRHDLAAALKFELGWSQRSFHAVIKQTSGRVVVENMQHRFSGEPNAEYRVNQIKGDARYSYMIQTGEKITGRGSAPARFYGFTPGAALYVAEQGVFSLVLEFEKLLASIRYVGPLRDEPRRLYRWSGEEPKHVGKHGERAIEVLLASSDQRVARAGEEARQLPVVVAGWLEQMGLIEEFTVSPIAANRREHEVLVRTQGAESEVNLADVGFGVSQVLPVIVECFCVEPNSIVIFEQPEIHLHPAAQADLADLFIEAIHAWENGSPRNVQFIIESHSEHFLRRLQRRIAEQKIGAEEVVMYFCEPPGPNGATLRRLEHDRYGRISNWPKNFFGDVLDDTAQQVRTAFERMRKEKADG